MEIVKGITGQVSIHVHLDVCIIYLFYLEKSFKGCKGIISVLYLQTIELIDNRKLKQIDSKTSNLNK